MPTRGLGSEVLLARKRRATPAAVLPKAVFNAWRWPECAAAGRKRGQAGLVAACRLRCATGRGVVIAAISSAIDRMGAARK